MYFEEEIITLRNLATKDLQTFSLDHIKRVDVGIYENDVATVITLSKQANQPIFYCDKDVYSWLPNILKNYQEVEKKYA